MSNFYVKQERCSVKQERCTVQDVRTGLVTCMEVGPNVYQQFRRGKLQIWYEFHSPSGNTQFHRECKEDLGSESARRMICDL